MSKSKPKLVNLQEGQGAAQTSKNAKLIMEVVPRCSSAESERGQSAGQTSQNASQVKTNQQGGNGGQRFRRK